MTNSDLDNQIIQSVLDREFAIIKDTPFCLCPIPHCSYLYFGTGKNIKPSACDSCKLKDYCDYNSDQNLDVKPILDCDEDLLNFLEERDENINDWF